MAIFRTPMTETIACDYIVVYKSKMFESNNAKY